MSQTELFKFDRLMPIQDFVEEGYVQELNRQFLHPLGLALVVVREHSDYRLYGVLDYRDDPEGIVFDPSHDLADSRLRKAQEIAQEQAAKAKTRQEALGFVVQPISGLEEPDETDGAPGCRASDSTRVTGTRRPH